MQRLVDEPLSLGYKLASNLDTYRGVWEHTQGMPPSDAAANWYIECVKTILVLLDEVEDSATESELMAKEEEARLRHLSCAPFPGLVLRGRSTVSVSWCAQD